MFSQISNAGDVGRSVPDGTLDVVVLCQVFGKALQIAAQHPPTTRKQANKTKEALYTFADDLEARGFPSLHSTLFRCVADGIET